MTTAEAYAPAKINLTLHVTGRRPDGYHLLDSLVTFGDIGDRITVSPSTRAQLTVSGPMARGVPPDRHNLVLRAAELMGVTADIRLDKHIPVAAGLGGGSSDAAATLHALSRVTGRPVPNPAALLTLGADVPVCLGDGLIRMRGIGDQLELLGRPPPLSLILVNPGVSVPTGAVFQRLERFDLAPMRNFPADQSGPDWMEWLAAQRNDLEAPAIALEPVIARVLDALRESDGCLLARMSGSGATCFAIMQSDDLRGQAVARLKQRFADWWVQPCNVNPSASR
jgi:4-diphosphocytidyl-2-C-methyl-D-erythritol kinase